MFRKMLKNDLKQKRGLSIVLFLFITAASVLVFVGGVQIYQFFTSTERNKTAYKSSDMIVYNYLDGPDSDKDTKKLESILDKNPHVVSRYKYDAFTFVTDCVDFPFVDEKKVETLKYTNYYLMTIPKNGDLIYTLDDQPFSVQNNTVWVSEKLRQSAYAEVGQKIIMTTDIGNSYELTIAGFYKQPYSDGSSQWVIVSDSDYELLAGEMYEPAAVYGVTLDSPDLLTFVNLFDEIDRNTRSYTTLQNPESSNEYILSYILAIFIALVSLFLILIVIMTIRFTMIAALKEEEREIGMLRAIGADSLKFRWLFAAKYTFFAIIGGIIGIIAGIPVSKTVLSTFTPGNIMPSFFEIILIGICSVLFINALIIGFSLLVMRHINKISVVNAIRGENRAERFGKGKSMLLHKRKKLAPSLYLACADLTKRFKRYVFLLVAYTLGVLIILFSVNIRNSVITPDFLKYSLIYQTDFFIEFNLLQLGNYSERITDHNEEFWDIVNEEIKDAGIAAHIDAEHYQTYGKMNVQGNSISSSIYWGSGDISKLSYHEGTVPVNKDEVALSWSAANSLGIMLGDEVELSIPTYSSEEQTYIEKKAKFRVTAFINAIDMGVPIAVISPQFNNPSRGKIYMALIIDSDDKDMVLEQLRQHFGYDTVLSGMEYTRNMLIDYSNIFDLLEYAVGSAIIFILILMTYLYSSVFIAEESSEIALLKSIGFGEGSIKAAHLFRILILSAATDKGENQ